MLAARVVVKVSLGEEKKSRTRNLRDAKDFVHDKRQEETAANHGKYSLMDFIQGHVHDALVLSTNQIECNIFSEIRNFRNVWKYEGNRA